jgi:hypothetical protein
MFFQRESFGRSQIFFPMSMAWSWCHARGSFFSYIYGVELIKLVQLFLFNQALYLFYLFSQLHVSGSFSVLSIARLPFVFICLYVKK